MVYVNVNGVCEWCMGMVYGNGVCEWCMCMVYVLYIHHTVMIISHS